jgi:5'-3' exonuclease
MGYGLAEIEEKKQVTLRENHKQIFLSRKLGKIKQDIKIDFELEKCSQRSYNKTRAKKAFQALGFNSLLNYLP